MKKPVCFLVVLFLAVVKLPAQTDLIAQIHFLGGDRISADTNSLYYTNEFASAEARAFESQTLDKLSLAPSIWFKQKLSPGAGNGSAQLRPLLDDFLKSEWVFEMRDAGNGSPEYALAIRLDNDRALLWNKNLRALLESWTKIAAQDTTDGWRLKKDRPPNLFEFSRQGDWVVLDCGQNELPLEANIAGSTAQTGETNWLTLNVDWPRLAQIFPALRVLDFPKIEIQAIGEGNLCINGKLHLSQPLPSLEAWRIPENEIHQPFASFTAARGLAPWLERQQWFRPFALDPQPGQFFAWALPVIPFQTFAAEPVPNANAALAQMDKNLTANTSWQSNSRLLTMAMNNGQITFRAPFMSPYLRADHAQGGDFISGGFFPNPPGSGPLPSQLMDQLNAPAVVYYNWEITSERLQELPELTQLILLVSQRQQLDVASAGAKWLKKFKARPGVTVTVATKTGPDEVTFVRTAPNGFTALELFGLAYWLDSPDFPSLEVPKAQY